MEVAGSRRRQISRERTAVSMWLLKIKLHPPPVPGKVPMTLKRSAGCNRPSAYIRLALACSV